MQSQLTETSASQVQVILVSQPPIAETRGIYYHAQLIDLVEVLHEGSTPAADFCLDI